MLHFGETDHGIPLTEVQKIMDRYEEMPIHVYPAGHGFNCDQRGSYDRPSAELALTRTLEFFHQNLA
jgi:carboxymethylenebutenolidase